MIKSSSHFRVEITQGCEYQEVGIVGGHSPHWTYHTARPQWAGLMLFSALYSASLDLVVDSSHRGRLPKHWACPIIKALLSRIFTEGWIGCRLLLSHSHITAVSTPNHSYTSGHCLISWTQALSLHSSKYHQLRLLTDSFTDGSRVTEIMYCLLSADVFQIEH